jgi:hypothetical protein
MVQETGPLRQVSLFGTLTFEVCSLAACDRLPSVRLVMLEQHITAAVLDLSGFLSQHG